MGQDRDTLEEWTRYEDEHVFQEGTIKEEGGGQAEEGADSAEDTPGQREL